MWEQQDGGLWLRTDYWPPKHEKVGVGSPPALTPAQQERAIALIRQGMPLKQVAELFDVSYEVVRRFARSRGVARRSERRLTPEQLDEAYGLLRADVPFREVAQRYGIYPESLRRLALRDGVELRARGQKLTPTARRLSSEQCGEARLLVQSGVSLRQTAKRLGISRSALVGLLREEKQER